VPISLSYTTPLYPKSPVRERNPVAAKKQLVSGTTVLEQARVLLSLRLSSSCPSPGHGQLLGASWPHSSERVP
jgi:hypothetical protein